MGAATWREDVPGMKILREVSQMSDPQNKAYRTVHYVRGVCAMFFMKEAMEWADANGGISGPNIRRAMYQRRDWVPQGLEGVCLPGTWEGTDHRGFARVRVYRGHVGGPTQDSLYDLFDGGTLKMEKLYEVDIPRRPDWLGW
jgi:branched-chain amino acid transport system substrate-binding protein